MKLHSLKRDRYNDLSTVAREINEAGVEKIESFDGMWITTDKQIYGLYMGVVSTRKRNDKPSKK